ncbi:MerR family transcriptional regulator [Kitasatospora sp. NBC_01287]|uniref:MerR family transcriptional regulator n=1 Tax=Kitasatospora sp. NBC_01287 TaxID=2903573 RepID=UPI0022573D33|nr:MerR family transcriptional regulator [Kitasatospora sp. NBC_01287]MCX4750547.1 MerR family transcriptional regulator [Kitasatospora sp. NBC_01287]
MQIGELAARSGVAERLLRYYEERELLAPDRTSAGRRRYQESDVARVSTIRALLAAGLNTSNIAIMLPCVGNDAGQLVPQCPEMVTRLARQRTRLDESIAGLEHSRRLVDALLAQAGR